MEDDKGFSTKAFEATGQALQNLDPVKQIHQHVCGLHYYANDKKRSVIAHHYCTHVNEDMHQCVIYDSDGPNARLIGIEYIITKKKFESLPAGEKKYWHSHVYEVKSGILYMPFGSAVPQVIQDKIENKEMEHLVNTYGKTWHLWQVDKGDEMPLGEPQLMMSFTKDGQMSDEVREDYETKHSITLQGKKDLRKDILFEPTDPLADQFI